MNECIQSVMRELGFSEVEAKKYVQEFQEQMQRDLNIGEGGLDFADRARVLDLMRESDPARYNEIVQIAMQDKTRQYARSVIETHRSVQAGRETAHLIAARVQTLEHIGRLKERAPNMVSDIGTFDIEKAILASIEGTQYAAGNGVARSAFLISRDYRIRHLNPIAAFMMKNPEIMSADREFHVKLADAMLGVNGDNAKAVELSALLKDVGLSMIADKNDVGMRVHARDRYIPTAVDMRKVIDRFRTADEFADFMGTLNIDWERSLYSAQGSAAQKGAGFQRSAMIEYWKDAQKLVSEMEKGNQGWSYVDSLAAKQEKAQNISFGDGESWMRFHETVGKNNSPLHAFLWNIEMSAHQYGVGKILGPNPVGGLLSMRDTLRNMVESGKIDLGARKDATLGMLSELERKAMNREGAIGKALTIALGEDMHPANREVAGVLGSIRMVASMAKLGMATLTALPADSMTSVHALVKATDWGFSKSLSVAMSNYKDVVRGDWGSATDAVLNNIAGFYDYYAGNAISRLSIGDESGFVQKAQNYFWRATGLQQWTDSARAANSMSMRNFIGDMAKGGASFDSLPARFRNMLEAHMIGPAKWEVMKGLVQDVEGRNIFLTDGVLRMSKDELSGLLSRGPGELLGSPAFQGEARSVWEASHSWYSSNIEMFRSQLHSELSGLITDHVMYGIIEPTARTRRLLLQGTQAGTWPGELLRFATMFKSFPVAFTERVLGRELFGFNDGGYRVYPGVNVSQDLFTLMGGLTVGGYLSSQLKGLAKGYTPESPTAEVITRAMIQGGTFGVFGDLTSAFLASTPKRMMSYLAGPVIGDFVPKTLGGAFDIARGYIGGSTKVQQDGWKSLTDVALTNMPYSNYFVTYAAMNWLLFDKVRSWAADAAYRKDARQVDKRRAANGSYRIF